MLFISPVRRGKPKKVGRHSTSSYVRPWMENRQRKTPANLPVIPKVGVAIRDASIPHSQVILWMVVEVPAQSTCPSLVWTGHVHLEVALQGVPWNVDAWKKGRLENDNKKCENKQIRNRSDHVTTCFLMITAKNLRCWFADGYKVKTKLKI